MNDAEAWRICKACAEIISCEEFPCWQITHGASTSACCDCCGRRFNFSETYFRVSYASTRLTGQQILSLLHYGRRITAERRGANVLDVHQGTNAV